MEKIKYGHMDCLTPECGTRCVVKRNPFNDTLSYSCQECGATAYAKKGEAQRAAWVKRITPCPVPDELAAAPAAAAPPAPEPGPAPRRKPPAPEPAPAPLRGKPATLLG